jgi:predicted TIM-barrel enzyme
MNHLPARANQRYFLPVIHIQSVEQALRNAQLAFNHGADGVWLIDHQPNGPDPLKLTRQCLLAVRQAYPDAFVGVNILFADTPADALAYVVRLNQDARVDGLWTDFGGISMLRDQTFAGHEAQQFVQEQKLAKLASNNALDIVHFGGVAFKGQQPIPHERLQDIAAFVHNNGLLDVICTSGARTGRAADPGKVQELKSGAGNIPLALASGVASDNVADYLPFVQFFLVASSICSSFHELDTNKVAELSNAIHSYTQS